MSIDTTRIAGIPKPVSRVGLGTWAIGGWMWGGTDDRQSIATVRKAVEQGINLIDTAPAYGFGHSESIVGEALVGIREQAVIAIKVALEWNEQEKITRNASVARIRREIEDSLRRLRTDHIDLYQVHWPDTLVPFDETAAELERLRRDGKILADRREQLQPRADGRVRLGRAAGGRAARRRRAPAARVASRKVVSCSMARSNRL
ncbi:MAG: aldo/keto reductase [Burkholderia sp.]